MRHNVGGGWGEKDAVAKVAGGEKVVGLGGESAKKRKSIGSCGTKAGPCLELCGVGEWRQ